MHVGTGGRRVEGDLVVAVNVDVAFALNCVTDLAWLWAAAGLAGLRPRGWRLALASSVGAAAAVWAYFPSGRWLASGAGAVLGTTVLLALAFLPCRLNQGVRLLAYFLFSGGAMAGTALLLGPRGAYPAEVAGSLPWQFPGGGLVAAGLLLCIAGARYLLVAVRERSRLARGLYSLRIRFGEGEVTVPALLDTGHALRDPLTGTSVAVVDADALQGLLPDGVLQAAGEGWEAIGGLPEGWLPRCRLVPFRAVGRPAGVLLAILPDDIALRGPGASEWSAVRALVGLSATPLHPDGIYRALVPPELAGEAGAA